MTGVEDPKEVTRRSSATTGDRLLIGTIALFACIVAAFASDVVWHWGPWW